MKMTAREYAELWLSYDIDAAYKAEIIEMLQNDPTKLEDAFHTGLEFGTGGMRGVMGVGTNRVNKYSFGKATQGLSNYLKKQFQHATLKVAIAYDCRHKSDQLAKMVANILSANGIHAYLFEALRPTPQLSFAVRQLGCQSGIVITASHNPPEYNGYKVYWGDGAQIIAPHDQGIIDEVNAIIDPATIHFEGNPALIHSIGLSMDEDFISASLAQRRTASTNQSLKIVFTSLHGTSITLMPALLEKAGYTNVHVVASQANPDGSFPTVKSPNPEEREALNIALSMAEELQADCVIGTDPDSDRIGVAVRNNKGEMMLLNGNQTGVILSEYLLSKTELKASDFIAYTIVSSEMFKDVANAHGIEAMVCLTGFKHIASLIREHEGRRRFIGGGEESYGYMVGDFVRDKDALTSALICCDWLGECLAQGISAEDYLTNLYRKHGLYQEHLVSLTKKGIAGKAEIDSMMTTLRSNPPTTLGGDKVVGIADVKAGTYRDLESGEEHNLNLPSSNVLQFFTASGSKVSARPSGTEPKIKFYFSVRAPWNNDKTLAEQEAALNKTIQEISTDLGL